MKHAREIRLLLLPWMGLLVGLLALAIVHQFGADGAFDDCQAFLPVPAIIVALIGIASAIAGAFASWRVLDDEKERPARRVIATVSVGMAALFAIAMTYPVIAALVIPPCFQ